LIEPVTSIERDRASGRSPVFFRQQERISIHNILWTQNIIPERQTATSSASIIAAVMVVVQYVVARWLARKEAALSSS
jgi:hypothetical protein